MFVVSICSTVIIVDKFKLYFSLNIYSHSEKSIKVLILSCSLLPIGLIFTVKLSPNISYILPISKS